MSPRPASAPAPGADAGPRIQGRELRARGKRTLARLLDAGTAVFAERGYHAARVDDIVKAAKTSHGTFYLYFSSKQDLFRSIAIEVASEMIELARDLPSLERPSPDRTSPDRASPDANAAGVERALSEWLERFAALYRRHGAFIGAWTEAEIADSEIGAVANDLVAGFSRELARRVRVAAPDLDPGVTAFALVSMIERTTYLVEAGQLPIDRTAAVATLAFVTVAALHGAPGMG